MLPGSGPRKTRVGATGQEVWFAYITPTEILRDKRGVGRRFKSEAAASLAIDNYFAPKAEHTAGQYRGHGRV